MIIRKAYRFRLKLHPHQARLCAQFAGCQRFVWNKALALQKARVDLAERCLPYNSAAALLVEWKKAPEHAFLCQAPAQTLQQTLKCLDRALRDAFDKKSPKRFPVFKKKGLSDSFRYPQGFKVDTTSSRLFLPKLGWVRYRNSRQIEGTPRNITVSRQGKHWFASVQVELERTEVQSTATSAVGVDMGVANFIALSDGTLVSPAGAQKKNLRRLAHLQRALSRKAKGSRNREKARRKVAKLQTKIGNARRDYLHKVSDDLSKNHALVVMEDLSVQNMTRSAKGTVEEPGKNVRAKSGLNRAILDQGWHEFRRQLEYKLTWRDGMLLLVPARNTSRKCVSCGHTSVENRRTQEKFRCVQCGHEAHADINAAENVLAAGHAVMACGGINDTREAGTHQERQAA